MKSNKPAKSKFPDGSEAQQQEEEDEESDYVDENFEEDETDEFWDFDRLPCHQLACNMNDLQIIDKKNQSLVNNQQLRRDANYQYVNPNFPLMRNVPPQ